MIHVHIYTLFLCMINTYIYIYIYIHMWLTHVFYLLILHSSLSGHKWIFPLFARNEVFPPWPICPIQRYANSNLDPQKMGDWSSKSIDSIEINVIWYNLCIYIYICIYIWVCVYIDGDIYFFIPILGGIHINQLFKIILWYFWLITVYVVWPLTIRLCYLYKLV